MSAGSDALNAQISASVCLFSVPQGMALVSQRQAPVSQFRAKFVDERS
ncbi:hypothetical protein T1E_2055 [Pseudomonas putida DOT-T1E]|uniref:Uncharacterized protein n=1 Tax=Pseudomonas putida (strain DOT-T1E) TaxID=1196325 RepID=I7B926_PSEPT|nr:hypothetical protein T1E_2055 [Pseudomonas putida DOT-T1E]